MSDPIPRLNAALEGRYRIERELGEGGMATVYLARDLKHERNVALKVLKPELAAIVGAERFLAEIKTTANLQHPHILPLHDSGEADGLLFYVMPYVEGETLRVRLDREHQLPVDDAVRIATNMAEALDYAHRHGVIHRDIKPANVLLQDGKPVISDFGIALAVGAAGGGRLTETGLSLGTPHYMSPEQATGDLNVGPATDIWALGCVLYEMLVGEPPFVGSTAQVILGRIITGKRASATDERASVPANVESAIAKALERLPADRFASPSDFARALGDQGFRHGASEAVLGARGPWKSVAIGATVVAVGATGMAAGVLLQPDEPRPLEVFELRFREGQELLVDAARSLSDDGTTLVYEAGPGRTEGQLWLRRWDDPQATARPIPGTEGATYPAISPDGTRVMFVQGERVKIMPLEGGAPIELAQGRMPVWGPDGFVYASSGRWDGVFRVPADGGPADTLTRRVRGETWHVVTDFLPDGSPLLTVLIEGETPDEIRVIDLESGEIRNLMEGSFPVYTTTDHLVYSVGSTLTARAWDVGAGTPRGPPVPLFENVRASVEVSASGKLIYSQDPSLDQALPDEMIWVDRLGRVSPVGLEFQAGGVFGFGWSLSPDGNRIALRHREAGNQDIWVKQLPDGPLERLTVSEAEDWEPWWMPDGRTVVYVSQETDERWGLWAVGAGDGTPPRRLHAEESRTFWTKGTWTPDGSWLVVTAYSSGNPDVVALRPGIDTVSTSLVASEFREHQPALSPDGRWLAYSSNRTGRPEIYVRPFPDVSEARIQVSTSGGSAPAWARSGREIFFLDEGQVLVSARVETVPDFRVVGREALFELPPRIRARSGDAAGFFGVDVDAQRFLMARERERSGADQLPRTYLVNNFLDELKRRVPH